MTIELNDDERDTLLIVLGMAAAVSMHQEDSKDLVPPIRLLIGKLAPTSYWALKPEGECSITAGDPDKLGAGTFR